MKSPLSIAIRLAMCCVAVGVSSHVAAQQSSGFTITPGVEYQMFDNELSLDNPFLGSIGLGYKTSTPWGFELSYLLGSSERTVNGHDIDVENYRLDALYHFAEKDGVQPYLLVGGGKQIYDYGSRDLENDMMNVGGGLKVKISDLLSMRTELRAVNDLENELLHFSVGLGLQFLLGGSTVSKAPISTAPADSDKDGVPDSQDRCPGTPAGTRVDTNGCELVLDEDGDGVSDADDQCPGTSTGARVDDKGCYIIISETREVQLRVNFANNSTEVTPDSYGEIESVAQFMREYPLTKVVLEGHTDDRGAAAYNQQLSEKRAASVAQVLVDRFGINQSRVSSEGFGESKPLVSNDTAERRAQNRRVTAKVTANVEKVQR